MNRQTGAVSPKLILSLLGIMFLIPLTLAWLMHSGFIDYRPGAGVNRGFLIDPPVRAELPEQFFDSGLNEHWILAHFLPASCDDGCRERLYGLHRVQRALGRDAGRTRILLLADNQSDSHFIAGIEDPEPGVTVVTSNTGKLSQQFESLGNQNDIFIVDPLGNIMMRYAPDSDPNDILFDLERLLQYQKTDPQ